MVADREDYEDRFITNEIGVITNPGKYEGEPLYVPYLWEEYVLHGFEQETISAGRESVEIVEVTDDIVEEFPELEGVEYVSLAQSNQGFVGGEELFESDLVDLRDKAQRIREQQEEEGVSH